LVTYNNELYVIDETTGKEIKKYNFNNYVKDLLSSARIDVYMGIIVIDYSNQIVVFDTNTDELVFSKQFSNKPVVKLGGTPFISGNKVIYSTLDPDEIVCVDYRTGKEMWKIEHIDNEDIRNFRLKRFGEEYYYKIAGERTFYEYSLETGEILAEHQIEKKELISNPDRHGYYPFYKNTGSLKKDIWLTENALGVFNMTSRGVMYAFSDNKFYNYGTDMILDWEISLPLNIWTTVDYGNYIFIDMFDKVILLNLERKEILWVKEYVDGEQAYLDIIGDSLYISEKDGVVYSYDLSVLED